MLAPDVIQAEQALGSFANEMKAIGNYIFGLSAGNFPPADIDGTSYDILGNFPVLNANLELARQHANVFGNLNVFFTVLMGLDGFNSTFQSTSNEILTTLAAASNNPNMQPTPAQQQSIASQLQTLLAAITERQNAVAALVPPAQTFADQLTSDHANLTSGENSISAAIAGINQWVETESMKFMEGPDGQGIANTIAAVGLQIINGLKSVQNSLETLVSQNETAAEAVSGILTVWQTLAGKYQDVISNLQQAGSGGILEAGDVSSAQLAWTELDKYLGSIA